MVGFHIPVGFRLALAEPELWVLLHQSKHGGMGAAYFTDELPVSPHKNQIEVRVPDQVNPTWDFEQITGVDGLFQVILGG